MVNNPVPQDLLKSYEVSYSRFNKRYSGSGTLQINGFDISFKSIPEYHTTFESAANATKEACLKAIEMFYKPENKALDNDNQ